MTENGQSNYFFHNLYFIIFLNEFVYKLNRRYFEEKLFDRLVIAGITGL